MFGIIVNCRPRLHSNLHCKLHCKLHSKLEDTEACTTLTGWKIKQVFPVKCLSDQLVCTFSLSSLFICGNNFFTCVRKTSFALPCHSTTWRWRKKEKTAKDESFSYSDRKQHWLQLLCKLLSQAKINSQFWVFSPHTWLSIQTTDQYYSLAKYTNILRLEYDITNYLNVSQSGIGTNYLHVS